MGKLPEEMVESIKAQEEKSWKTLTQTIDLLEARLKDIRKAVKFRDYCKVDHAVNEIADRHRAVLFCWAAIVAIHGMREPDGIPLITHAEGEAPLLREMLRDCFNQACYCRGDDGRGEYDHMCIGIWEDVQQMLLAWGMLDPKQCSRP